MSLTVTLYVNVANSMNCIYCNKTISKARLDALPNTKVCVNCSREEKLMGLPILDDDSPTIVIVTKKQHEQLRSLQQDVK